MLARQIDRLPAGSGAAGMLFEPKWDGFRALAMIDRNGGIDLVSRRGKTLKRGFPEVVAAVHAALPADTVVDGEIVRWSAEGRLDFGALQHRNTTARPAIAQLAVEEPCHLICFDVLRVAGRDMVGEPLLRRRKVLEDLFADVPGASALALGLQTDDLDTARAWYDDLTPVGVEGIMIKPASSRYRAGDRSVWRKVKHYASTEAIIGGVTGGLDRPAELIVGRYASDSGELIVAGRTVPLHTADSAAVGAVLTRAQVTHPWPEMLPGGWGSAGRPTDYIRVDPTVVAEIRVDVAIHGDRWRHGLRFLRLRSDLDVSAVPTDLDTYTAN
jgi:ATP-dependent DNA ligase